MSTARIVTTLRFTVVLPHPGSDSGIILRDDRSPRSDALSGRELLLRLQLRLVGLDEGFDVLRHLEELEPLLFVERDREPAEAVERDAALVADPGWREPSGSMAWSAPMAAKAASRSNAPAPCSGGNSTTRKIVPLAGGSSTTFRAAASALPSLRAGEPSVTQRFVSPKSARPGSV